ncbi:unnamed protein product [Arabis nemorensis]|uniref:Uncharacterized protein n=1 Tax=Arabis nemorensis TaxID=586526 RepID=A0A565AT43_9BRAS|nr:unnamed protein product [Arabis nemorensis]
MVPGLQHVIVELEKRVCSGRFYKNKTFPAVRQQFLRALRVKGLWQLRFKTLCLSSKIRSHG